jgi:cyanophycinase
LTNHCAAGILLSVAALLYPGAAGVSFAQVCGRPCVGPESGALLAAGGGELGREIYSKFLELAGGKQARIVLIPTAGAEDGSHDAWTALAALRNVGARRIEVLHTRNRKIADLAAFASPLREADGVWISGGRQHRLIDVYLDTRTHRELDSVLARGGVIGGNSAGASVLASYLIRGAESSNDVVVDPDRSRGFGFLRTVAVDQHLLARQREFDLLKVLRDRPELLGIGIDEGTAMIVTGDLASVVGEGRVAIYDFTDPLALIPLRYLQSGAFYDLGARRVIHTGGAGEQAEPAPDPRLSGTLLAAIARGALREADRWSHGRESRAHPGRP